MAARTAAALLRPWLDDLAAIVARGVEAGAFLPPRDIDDFTIRFIALLDGLALQRLRQLHQLSRKRLIALAMDAARLELALGSQPEPGEPPARPRGPRTD
jgi:hypothetical protein